MALEFPMKVFKRSGQQDADQNCDEKALPRENGKVLLTGFILCFVFSLQQQPELSVLHPQEGSPPVIIPLMIAAAQPTPE